MQREIGGSFFYPERFSAVNMTSPHGTYEVRVFRSTTSTRKLLAALGLVSASIEYTRELTASDICQRDGWRWGKFAEWVRDHDQYQPLYREMEDRECVS
jgi:hypothetical protein